MLPVSGGQISVWPADEHPSRTGDIFQALSSLLGDGNEHPPRV